MTDSYACTLVPLGGRPDQRPPPYKATLYANEPRISVFNLPLRRGHLSYGARFSIPHNGGLIRGGLLTIFSNLPIDVSGRLLEETRFYMQTVRRLNVLPGTVMKFTYTAPT